MAKNYFYTLQTTVQFDNKDALKKIDELQSRLKKVKEEEKELKFEKLDLDNNNSNDKARIKSINKELSQIRTEKKTLTDAIAEARTDFSALRAAAAELENMSLRQVIMAQKEANQFIKANAHKDSEDAKKKVADTMHMMDLFKARRAELESGFHDLIETLRKDMKGLSLSELERAFDILSKYGEYMVSSKRQLETLKNTIVSVQEEIAKGRGFDLLETRMKRGSDSATNAQIEDYIKFYKRLSENSMASAKQVEDANKKIEAAQKILDTRKADKARSEQTGVLGQVESGQFKGTIEDTNKAIESLKALKASLDATDAAGIKRVDDAIAKLNEDLNKTEPLYRRISDVNTKIEKGYASTVTETQWNEYIKYYKNIAESASSSAEEVQAANEKIAQAQSMLNNVDWQKGYDIIKQVTTGTFSGTVNTTKEAIEQLKKLRGLIDISDTPRINMVDAAIEQLKAKISATNETVIAAKDNLKKFSEGGLDLAGKNADELERMKKELQEYQKTLKGNNVTGLKDVQTLITQIEQQQKKLNSEAFDYEKIIKNIDQYSLEELKAAYEALKDEVSGMSEKQEDFNKKAAQMRDIDRQVQKLNDSMRSHTSIMENAVNKLRNYVLVYMSFNKAKEIFTSSWDDLKNLSDQMTNVQKVTNLAAEEVEYMTDRLQALDTRISTTQLMDLAEQAGKMGIAAQGGAQAITDFVKAGQLITSTLGEDIGGAEAVSKILKVNDLINDSSEGIEKDMNRIGSAILNIGNNSKASYADIVEFTTRMGAVGSVAKMSMTDIMALGGTFSALGGNMESSSTAMTRILMAMQTKTDAIAKASHITAAEMRQMMNNGQSMEALYEVLTHIKEDGAEGIENLLTAVGGRNNAQAKTAVALLTDNIDRLRMQMVLAEEGFDDGTLAMQEYEKANDNLAGTMERVTHEMGEMAVNSTWAKMWNYPAKGLLYFIQTLKQSCIAMGAFIALVFSLTVAMGKSAMSITAVRTGITSLWTSIKGSGTLIVRLIATIGALTTSLWKGKAGIDATRASWGKLKLALSANGLGFLLSILAAAVTYFMNLKNAVKGTTEQIQEMKGELESETQDLYYLVGRLKDVNVEQDKRKQYISEFNSKFGQYLHNMIDEASTYNEIAAAAARAEAAINKKTASALRSQGMTKALENNQEDLNDATAKLRKSVVGMGNKFGSKSMRENVVNTILSVVNSELATNKDMVANDKDYEKLKESIIAKVKKQIKKDFGEKVVRNLDANSDVYDFFNTTFDYAGKYADVQRKVQKQKNEYEWVAEGYEGSAKKLNETAISKSRTVIDDLYNKYQEKGSKVKASTIMNNIYNMLDTAKELDIFKDKEFDHYKGMLVNLSKNIKDYGRPVSIYEDMGKASPKQLKEYIDKLEDFAKTFREGENAQKLYPDLQLPKGIEYWKQKDASDWAYKEATTAKEILKTYHMNRDANFTWEKGRKDKDKETQDMDAALKKLDEFYKRREEILTIALNKGELTEEEFNRRNLKNEAEHLEERQNLRKKFMDGTVEFGHEYIAELMKDVDFDKINKYVTDKGARVTDDLRLQIAKDAVKIQTDLKKAQDAIRNVLFGEDNFKKLTNTFTKDLDMLDLLLPGIKTDENGNFDKGHLESEIAKRTEWLLGMVKDGATMESDKFKEKIKNWNFTGEAVNGAGFEGWDNWALDDKQIEQLLDRFKKFSIDYNKELRKDANEIKRQIDEENAENGFDSNYTEREKKMEKERSVMEQFYGNYNMSPFMNKSAADRMELEMYDLKIQKIQEYMDKEEEKFNLLIKNAKTDEERVMRQRQLDYLLEEGRKELTEVMSEQSQKQADIALKTVEKMRPYADMVNQFADDFGKNLFGKVEDRKAAAKALLTQFTKTTMSMLTQELNYLAVSKMANKAAKIENMEDTAHDAIQTNTMNAAKGVGQEVGKRGILGFATSAAITAGMTLLTAIITSALSRGKSEIGVSTGKLSTGMLTYANGRYPTYADGTMDVQGNDGKTYNAVVKPNLTTGEYSKPHLGIVGEDGAELIVDHKTYMGLKQRAPHVLQGIYDMHRYGRLRLDYDAVMRHNEAMASMMMPVGKSGLRTYASGNIDEVLGNGSSLGTGEFGDSRLVTALERNNIVMEKMLTDGVKSQIVMLGDDGLYKKLQRAERFMKGKG